MPTPATNPTYFDPDTYPTFSLHDAGGSLLVRLPPFLKLTDGLGHPDPYTWDRPPGSGAWFPLGDGLPRERPTMTLQGQAQYATREAALAYLSLVKSVLPQAASLYWIGQPFQNLDTYYPGSDLSELGDRAKIVNHRYVLNIRGTAVTGLPGQPVPGTTPPPPDTGHY